MIHVFEVTIAGQVAGRIKCFQSDDDEHSTYELLEMARDLLGPVEAAEVELVDSYEGDPRSWT